MHVLTFSRHFPAYHPKAGDTTHFVEKIHSSLGIVGDNRADIEEHIALLNIQLFVDKKELIVSFTDSIDWENEFLPKHHTIRAGHRFKAGDWFSPRVWSGQPYRSKQIIIAPPIQVKKVWDFDLMKGTDKWILCLNGVQRERDLLLEIAQNDGLDLSDLLAWFKFPKPTTNCQIICWNDKITY